MVRRMRGMDAPDPAVEALERESGLTVGYDATGTLLVALHRDHLALLEHLYAFQVERGLPAERLSGRAAPTNKRHLVATLRATLPQQSIDALATLDGLGALADEHLQAAWRNASPDVQRHALRLAGSRLNAVRATAPEVKPLVLLGSVLATRRSAAG